MHSSRLASHPSVAKPQLGDYLPKAVCKAPVTTEVAAPRISDGDPVVLGRPVDSQMKFSRPPICSTLIDKGDQFLSCLLGAIDELHEKRLYGCEAFWL